MAQLCFWEELCRCICVRAWLQCYVPIGKSTVCTLMAPNIDFAYSKFRCVMSKTKSGNKVYCTNYYTNYKWVLICVNSLFLHMLYSLVQLALYTECHWIKTTEVKESRFTVNVYHLMWCVHLLCRHCQDTF